ncbi:unnamed protein product [Gadus morhua 'NCC']
MCPPVCPGAWVGSHLAACGSKGIRSEPESARAAAQTKPSARACILVCPGHVLPRPGRPVHERDSLLTTSVCPNCDSLSKRPRKVQGEKCLWRALVARGGVLLRAFAMATAAVVDVLGRAAEAVSH